MDLNVLIQTHLTCVRLQQLIINLLCWFCSQCALNARLPSQTHVANNYYIHAALYFNLKHIWLPKYCLDKCYFVVFCVNSSLFAPLYRTMSSSPTQYCLAPLFLFFLKEQIHSKSHPAENNCCSALYKLKQRLSPWEGGTAWKWPLETF